MDERTVRASVIGNESGLEEVCDENHSLISNQKLVGSLPQHHVSAWTRRSLLLLAKVLQLVAGLVLFIYAADALTVPLWPVEEKEALSDVTLMVLVTEWDIVNIPRRIEGISSSLGIPIGPNRFFVVDAHKTNGHVSPELKAVMEESVRRGFMDGFVVFNESSYDSQARDAHFGAPMRLWERIGNAVYYYMPETCRTRYLLHYDVDVQVWHRPGRSWVADGREFLKDNADVWILAPPTPFYHHFVERFDLGGVLFRLLRIFFSWGLLEVQEQNYINSQVYLMDTQRCREMLQFPVSSPVKVAYSTQHWETTMKTLMMSMNHRFHRVSLADCTAYWSLHYSTKDAEQHLVPIPELAKQGFAVTGPRVFSPAPLSEWDQALAELASRQEPRPFATLTCAILVLLAQQAPHLVRRVAALVDPPEPRYDTLGAELGGLVVGRSAAKEEPASP